MLIGLERDTSDAFFTKPDVAKQLVVKLETIYDITKFDQIIEPSAGSGAFSDCFIGRNLPIKAYDIKPMKKGIIKQDYMNFKFNGPKNSNVLVVGNPPFGRQSGLARKFIQKSAEYAHVIAFILPRSFKKDSYRAFFPLNFHLVFQQSLKKNSFIVGQEEHDVPCVFQIWEKRETERAEKKAVQSMFFDFVAKDDSPDFAVRRIGVYAGRIFRTIGDKSENSHYFLKINTSMVTKKRFFNFYNEIKFNLNNTVGPNSISKPELINATNRAVSKALNSI